MDLIRCPECGLPRTANDVIGSPCPVCRRPAGDPPTDEPLLLDLPPLVALDLIPPAAPTMPRTGVFAVGLTGGVAAAIAVVWAFGPAPTTPPTPTPASAAAAVGEPAPLPQATAPRPPEVAPAPRYATNNDPSVDLPSAGDAVVRIDRPGGEAKLGVVSGRRTVRLVGRADRLVVAGVAGGATLDATELEVGSVVVTGPVGGGSTVAVRTTPRGLILFHGRVDGRAAVTADAGGGFVGFAVQPAKGAAPAGIDGGATVRVAARAVVFGGPIGGENTHVDATLERDGTLRFRAVERSARLVYRGDPAVQRGAVRGGEVRRE